jgi:hypothetical protein
MITLVCVLIVYNGWANVRYRDVVGIIVGPIIAMFVTHVFSASLAQHVALERRLPAPESFVRKGRCRADRSRRRCIR